MPKKSPTKSAKKSPTRETVTLRKAAQKAPAKKASAKGPASKKTAAKKVSAKAPPTVRVTSARRPIPRIDMSNATGTEATNGMPNSVQDVLV